MSVWGVGLRVEGGGLRVQDLGWRVWVSRIWGSGFRVQSSEFEISKFKGGSGMLCVEC